jgi:hypothetical protein
VRPLEHTLHALSDGDEMNLVLAGETWPPAGECWFLFSEVLDSPDVISGWVDELLAGEARGRRDVAGSYLSSWIAGTLAGVPAGALIAGSRAWPLEPENIALRRHADGWFDGMALRSAALWVLPDDPDAGHPDVVVVATPDELRARLAAEIVRVVDPMFARVREATRYPSRSMWGSLADGIASMALWRDRRAGSPDPEVWERAGEFLDRLESRARLLKDRPTLGEVTWSGGCHRISVKSTCCLYFKIFDGEPDPEGEGYCSSCPFRSEESRKEKWSTWLEEQAAAILTP